ncbi:MAG: hypothetical protein AAFQ82_23110, partial [Myxococcota bacterium]
KALIEEDIGNGIERSNEKSYIAFLDARRDARFATTEQLVNEVVQNGETVSGLVARVVGTDTLRNAAEHLSAELGRPVDVVDVAEWVTIRLAVDNDLPSLDRLPPGLTVHIPDYSDPVSLSTLLNIGRMATVDPNAYSVGLLETLNVPERGELRAAISRARVEPRVQSAEEIRESWNEVSGDTLRGADVSEANIELVPLDVGEPGPAVTAIQADTHRIVSEELEGPLEDPAWRTLELRAYYASLTYGVGSDEARAYVQRGVDEHGYTGSVDSALSAAAQELDGVSHDESRASPRTPAKTRLTRLERQLRMKAMEAASEQLYAAIGVSRASQQRQAAESDAEKRDAVKARIEARLVREVTHDAALRFDPDAEPI